MHARKRNSPWTIRLLPTDEPSFASEIPCIPLLEDNMFKNEGKTDRWIRVLLGVVILAFIPKTNWAWLGLIPLVTGAVGYCALYQLLGWTTNRAEKHA